MMFKPTNSYKEECVMLLELDLIEKFLHIYLVTNVMIIKDA